jgi:exopolysaccharide biosynthesis predicted pyruvyltransferase EpsI
MKKTRLKNHPMETDTWCSHIENGLMGIPKICIRDFECRHCAFYYWLEEVGAAPVCDECSPVDFLRMEAA